MVRRLLAVESVDERTGIVVHSNMLMLLCEAKARNELSAKDVKAKAEAGVVVVPARVRACGQDWNR